MTDMPIRYTCCLHQ